ncbi:proline-rich transmembrane protein 1-like [Parambassis ranga]|uniref:Proline-rich transmembrane protein 1-like n=1 Tax=Parambassis ranga TaxID=210632 RepID=A0A6P7JW05_9TELE|nr:proline-rich transmembrane protein 1-like [Parambassis ranga]
MDPEKSTNGPPMGWTDGKSPMDQPAPPPYNPYQGYSQPVPGYQPPPQDFGQPPQYGTAGYGQQPYPMGQPYPTGQPYLAGQMYPPQPNTVTVQPTVFVAQPLANPVKDYLGFSIFTMMCCCLPLGIAALIYSISAREANHVGNRMLAEQSSRTARTLNHVGLGIGIGAFILMVVYAAVMASMF